MDLVPALDLSDLEQDFCIGAPVSKVTESALPLKKPPTTLLGLTRANNVGEQLFRIKSELGTYPYK